MCSGQDELMEILLRNGANVDIQNRDGWTALHAASEKGKKNIHKLFYIYIKFIYSVHKLI